MGRILCVSENTCKIFSLDFRVQRNILMELITQKKRHIGKGIFLARCLQPPVTVLMKLKLGARKKEKTHLAECEYLVAHCDITKSCSVSAVIHTRVMYTYKYIVYIVFSSFLGSLHVISIASRKRSGDLLYLFGLFRNLQHSDVVLAEK